MRGTAVVGREKKRAGSRCLRPFSFGMLCCRKGVIWMLMDEISSAARSDKGLDSVLKFNKFLFYDCFLCSPCIVVYLHGQTVYWLD